MYELQEMPIGAPYPVTGSGEYIIKVRAVSRDSADNPQKITEKRGVAFRSDDPRDLMPFMVEAYSQWDRRGEFQFTTSLQMGDDWTSISAGQTDQTAEILSRREAAL